ncbi:hypothetical protein PSACC_01235 [Paramicrosporidium saccamoebae]|uniref:Uncharacterized protein n=1 Tax=Paramicrosporidium saccamoebae TaxID=1246581 RepID=A0A2H9TMF7_9FUNG|nr:hypothetical protein PSACC_01235 [Paramicrosporidium saccamoebae]
MLADLTVQDGTPVDIATLWPKLVNDQHWDELRKRVEDNQTIQKQSITEPRPDANFSKRMMSFLKNLYRDAEVPLMVKYCAAGAILDDEKVGEERQFTVTPGTVGFTQDRFMTQPPDVLLRSPEKNGGQEISDSFNLGFDTQGFTVGATNADEMIDVINESQPTAAALPLVSSPKPLPDRLVKFLESFTIIPAVAFRSILCTNDDELVGILEGTHATVAAFLTRNVQTDENTRPEEEQKPMAKRCKLLDRHESAERIAWSSLINSPIKKTQSGQGKKWSKGEEMRLIDGYGRFGQDWALIQSNLDFAHRKDQSLKDKVQQLINTGRIPK